MNERGWRTLRWLLLGSVVAASSGLAACLECTQVGCHDGVSVVILPAAGEQLGPSSRWVIEATTATQTFSCTVRSDEDGTSQIDSGCTLPSAFGDSRGLRFTVPLDQTDAAAGTLSLRVVDSGRTLVDETDVAFTAEAFRPNGPYCPPSCLVADVTLEAIR